MWIVLTGSGEVFDLQTVCFEIHCHYVKKTCGTSFWLKRFYKCETAVLFRLVFKLCVFSQRKLVLMISCWRGCLVSPVAEKGMETELNRMYRAKWQRKNWFKTYLREKPFSKKRFFWVFEKEGADSLLLNVRKNQNVQKYHKAKK